MPSRAGILLPDPAPMAWGTGFAGALALPGTAGALRSGRATAVTGAVTGRTAVAACALPLKLHIVVATAAAVAIGLLTDQSQASAGRAVAPVDDPT